jgi:hypothetical protein
MIEHPFEGSIVLEKLAEQGLLDDFYEAVDADDVSKAISLMRKAQLDEDTIELTVTKMYEAGENFED